MMMSSNGNVFRVTGHLCGEFTGPRWIPAQRPVTRSFDVFFDLRPNKRLSKQWWGWWFETPSCPLWRHCNVLINSWCNKCESMPRRLIRMLRAETTASSLNDIMVCHWLWICLRFSVMESLTMSMIMNSNFLDRHNKKVITVIIIIQIVSIPVAMTIYTIDSSLTCLHHWHDVIIDSTIGVIMIIVVINTKMFCRISDHNFNHHLFQMSREFLGVNGRLCVIMVFCFDRCVHDVNPSLPFELGVSFMCSKSHLTSILPWWLSRLWCIMLE